MGGTVRFAVASVIVLILGNACGVFHTRGRFARSNAGRPRKHHRVCRVNRKRGLSHAALAFRRIRAWAETGMVEGRTDRPISQPCRGSEKGQMKLVQYLLEWILPSQPLLPHRYSV